MRASRLFTIVLLGAGAALLAQCSEPKAPAVKRVLVHDPVGVNPVAPMRRSEQRIALEQREAYTQTLGETLELPLAAMGRARMRTAAALVAPEGVELPEGVQVTFIAGWEIPSASQFHAAESVDARAAAKQWTPITVRLGDPLDPARAFALAERTRLFLRVTANAALPPGVRVAWAVPEVEGYFGAPLSKALGAAERARPNVLFVSVDTLRADHVSCYGYARATTPRIDALAAQGVLFEDAISPAPWTLPSYGSAFTGLLPGRHAAGLVRERQQKYGTDDPCELKGAMGTSSPLREGVPTLAQLLAEAGWRTAEFSNNAFLNPAYGLDRGFQRFVSYQYNALAGVELARAWIAEQDRPWFCFLHVMDPHMPYAPPEPWDAMFRAGGLGAMDPGWPPVLADVRAMMKKNGRPGAEFIQAMTDFYDGDIAFADDQIGRLLAALDAQGVLANTIVVLHSDHGEELWEHEGFEHGHALHAELLHVPLILRFDGKLPRGARVKERVRAFDVFPTLLELAGLPVPAGIDAESLLPSIRATAPLPPRDVTAEFLLYGEHEAKARYVGAEKLIATRSDVNLVFDVLADRAERNDLAAQRPAFVARERAFLAELQKRTLANLPPFVRPKLSDGELHQQLQDGYGGEGDDEEAPKPGKKP